MVIELKIFKNEEFGEVRTVILDNVPYFVAKDIALALGYKDPKNTIKNRCKKGRVSEIPHPQNQEKSLKVMVIPESDIYRLIIGSKLETAQIFESWLFDEVLPTIRRHGAYMTSEVIEKTLTDPDYLIRLATALKDEQQARKLAESKLEEQKPLVDFAKHVTESSDAVDIGEFAKIVKNERIDLGRNRLFEWLRKNKYLMSNNVPYQKYIDCKYFDVVEAKKETPYGPKLFTKTLITGRGQVVFVEKLRKEFGDADE